MAFIFFAFSSQKWTRYTAEMLVPLISHSSVIVRSKLESYLSCVITQLAQFPLK
jgi:hypothetical protein